MGLEAGKIVTGKVSGITPFGAFITLEDNKTGLVHISEVALSYVKDIHDHLKIGDTVTVKVLSIDSSGKISLSIKQALSDARKGSSNAGAQRRPQSRPGRLGTLDRPKEEPQSFEDMMTSFKRDSDERMQAIKRGVESKRGSSYRRPGGSF